MSPPAPVGRTRSSSGEEGWLFQSGNALLNRNSASHQWRQIRARIGMDEFTLHDLRHFYAMRTGCGLAVLDNALTSANSQDQR